jgi:aspartyl-tRNA(Asn)/glutamyl-tRNA(Gln) amidotransferase subunit A
LAYVILTSSCQEYHVKEISPEIVELWDTAAKWLSDKGAEIVDISLPHTQHALATYYVIATAEASSNLARYDGLRYGHRAEGESVEEMMSNSRSEGFGAEVKRRILLGNFVLSRK